MAAQDESERPRRGRWRSGEQSRQRILAAARAGFARSGFERTTVRAIAAEAQVDPAVIHYFFKTKEQLFLAAMQPEAAGRHIAQLLDAGVERFVPRLLAYLLRVWDAADDFEPLVALLRSAPTHDGSARLLRDLIHEQIGARLATVPGVHDIELRLGLFSTQLIGLLVSRYVLHLEPIASTDPETLVRWLGPVLQAYLAGPAPEGDDSPPRGSAPHRGRGPVRPRPRVPLRGPDPAAQADRGGRGGRASRGPGRGGLPGRAGRPAGGRPGSAA